MSTTLTSLRSMFKVTVSVVTVTAVLLLLPQSVSACETNKKCTETISASYKNSLVEVLQQGEGFIPPYNTTAYNNGGSVNFTATFNFFIYCPAVAYKNDCRCSDYTETPVDGLYVTVFTINNISMADDGTRVDICAHCLSDGLKCFPPAYLNVKDKPVLSPDDVYAIATCNGIQVKGQEDNDTVIMATVKDSLNHTLHQCNISSLPYSANCTVLPPDICDVNSAGVGEPLELANLFEELIDIQQEFSRLLTEFNDSAHASLMDSTSKPEGSEFSLRLAFTVITLNTNISFESLYFQVPVNKTCRKEVFLSTRRDYKLIRIHFEPVKFDRLLKMNMHRFYIYGKDNRYGNSIEAINEPCKRLEWWICVIIKIFIYSGASHCASFLMIANTVWMNQKLKKYLKNSIENNRVHIHLPVLVKNVIRTKFFCHDTCCFTIPKLISQITVTRSWEILKGSCPTTPIVVTPTDQAVGKDERFYWKEVIKIEHIPHYLIAAATTI